jgi:hypothetical protein
MTINANDLNSPPFSSYPFRIKLSTIFEQHSQSDECIGILEDALDEMISKFDAHQPRPSASELKAAFHEFHIYKSRALEDVSKRMDTVDDLVPVI